MFGNRSLLSHIQILKSQPHVTLVDGSHASVVGIDTSSPLPTLPLSSVLHYHNGPLIYFLLTNSPIVLIA